MMKKSIWMVAGAFCVAVPSYAIDSGCGLGSMIFKKNSKLSQTLAVTTNASSYTQIFGITSGTSGCSASGLVQNEERATEYAAANFQDLKTDLARGGGDHALAFAEILGCQGAAASALGSAVRSEYAEVIPSSQSTPGEIVSLVKARISRDPYLASACNVSI